MVESGIRWIARRALPEGARRWLRAQWERGELVPPVGFVRFGSLRRTTPISREYGFDRGQPIDRHYIETFLARHADDVAGRVLEIKDDGYTRRFGGGRVARSDVLCLEADDPHATIVGDLVSADHVPSASFDCAIVTQTLQLIFDVRAALATIHRILKPGGVLLATVPGLSQVSPHEDWGDRWAWGFTRVSARGLVAEAFPGGEVEVEAFGNVMTAVAYLHGLSTDELRPDELAHHDPEYQLSIGIRARKAAAASAEPSKNA
jgi:SAM-dependent methyltransferase